MREGRPDTYVDFEERYLALFPSAVSYHGWGLILDNVPHRVVLVDNRRVLH